MDNYTNDERIDILKEATYFNNGKLPKTKADAVELLKLAQNLPLTDKEIDKKVLSDIKRNENVFCKKGTCKGFADFDKYMRGVEPMETEDMAVREEKGINIFKKKVGRDPNFENPLHVNLVTAFAYSDLSAVKKPAPAKKVAPKAPVKKVTPKK